MEPDPSPGSEHHMDLLDSYPRLRPPLPEAQARIYVAEYRRNRRGESVLTRVVQRLEGWMHQAVRSVAPVDSLLELGAGTLNHVPYEPLVARYDVVEPFEDLCRDSPHRSRISQFYGDVTEIPTDHRYDRIVSVAVLEHLTDLPAVVAESVLRLCPTGELASAFPSEGGMLWALAWRLTTGVSYRLRTGLSYQALMRHEHVNTAEDILGVLRYFFGDVMVTRHPLPGAHTSFYTAARAMRPDQARAQAWLRARGVAGERRTSSTCRAADRLVERRSSLAVRDGRRTGFRMHLPAWS
jgi:hypothetical protein